MSRNNTEDDSDLEERRGGGNNSNSNSNNSTYLSVASHEDEDEDDGLQVILRNNDDDRQRRRSCIRTTVGGTIIVLLALNMIGLIVQYNRASPTTSRWFGQNVSNLGLEGLRPHSSLTGLSTAAVAADHPKCSQVGMDVMKLQGGNAVDAAVAVTLCLGVANPSSSGLGGGSFLLLHMNRQHFRERRKQQKQKLLFLDKRTDGDDDQQDQKTDPMITEVIDCRETAPGAATEDMFLKDTNPSSVFGGLAPAVPGELRGLELAHARHGSLPWSDVVKPAWLLAKDGIPVTEHMARDIRLARKNAEIRWNDHDGERYDALRDFVSKSNDWNDLLGVGDLLRNPKLADVLKDVMERGANALYESERTQDIVSDIQKAGGIISVDDFKNYRPVLRTPLVASASGHTIVGIPPPSSGGAVVIGILRFLQGYAAPLSSSATTLSIHRLVEAMRHSFAMRMSLSDEEPAIRTVHDLTKGSYMESLRRNSSDTSVLPLSQYGGTSWAKLHDSDGINVTIQDKHEGDRRRKLANTFGYLEDNGTTHFSVVDKDGNAVAVTSSINGIFGSYVMSPSTGIIMGNTMDDFGNPGKENLYGLRPNPENYVAPGKRPLSSMSPSMIFLQDEKNRNIIDNDDLQNVPSDNWGKLRLIVGASGGPKIITSVVQVILNYCILGMPLFESVSRPRVHDQLLYHGSATTTVENSTVNNVHIISVPMESRMALLQRGHDTLIDIDYAGAVQAIGIDGNQLISAVCDIRKGGMPAGY